MPELAGLSVSRETVTRLEAFAALVEKWTPRINLIAKASQKEIWQRHIIDSAQLFALAPPDFTHWTDLGSGGGFPGIVVAALAQENHPNAAFTLIESDQRKATFLRTAIRELGLPGTVLSDRIEAAAPQYADVVSARALAPLPDLLPLIRRHMNEDGRALIHKGRQAASEIAKAEAAWSFTLEDHPSITDPNARLLDIQRIRPRG